MKRYADMSRKELDEEMYRQAGKNRFDDSVELTEEEMKKVDPELLKELENRIEGDGVWHS